MLVVHRQFKEQDRIRIRSGICHWSTSEFGFRRSICLALSVKISVYGGAALNCSLLWAALLLVAWSWFAAMVGPPLLIGEGFSFEVRDTRLHIYHESWGSSNILQIRYKRQGRSTIPCLLLYIPERRNKQPHARGHHAAQTGGPAQRIVHFIKPSGTVSAPSNLSVDLTETRVALADTAIIHTVTTASCQSWCGWVLFCSLLHD